MGQIKIQASPQTTSDLVTNFLGNSAGLTAVAWVGISTTKYSCILGAGLISKVAVHVSVSSGNIDIGVYSGTGVGNARQPNAKLVSTGSTACPVPGYAVLNLSSPIYCDLSMYFGMTCDNTTASFFGTSGNVSDILDAQSLAGATAFPLPATASSLSGASNRNPWIIGLA